MQFVRYLIHGLWYDLRGTMSPYFLVSENAQIHVVLRYIQSEKDQKRSNDEKWIDVLNPCANPRILRWKRKIDRTYVSELIDGKCAFFVENRPCSDKNWRILRSNVFLIFHLLIVLLIHFRLLLTLELI